MTFKATSKRGSGRKTLIGLMGIVLLIGTGCATEPGSVEAVRDELNPLVADHAEGLAEDGGPKSLQTGRNLIATYDCLVENEQCQ